MVLAIRRERSRERRAVRLRAHVRACALTPFAFIAPESRTCLYIVHNMQACNFKVS